MMALHKARENARQSPYLKPQLCDPDVYDDYDDDRVDSDPEVYDIDHDDRVDSDAEVDIDHDGRSDPDDCLAIDCEMICVRDRTRPMKLASVAIVDRKLKVVYYKILRPPPAHLINVENTAP